MNLCNTNHTLKKSLPSFGPQNSLWSSKVFKTVLLDGPHLAIKKSRVHKKSMGLKRSQPLQRKHSR